MNLVVNLWFVILVLPVVSIVMIPKSTILICLYLGLYGLHYILLIMNISALLRKIWLLFHNACSEAYKQIPHFLVVSQSLMNYNLLFLIYLLTLSLTTLKAMENLNINGDSGSSSKRPNLTQAELLDLCIVGRVVVNKPVHLATLEARLGPIWEPKYRMTLIPMEGNKFMVQLYSQADLVRILNRSPWLLDNNMIILKKVAIGEDPMKISMESMEIWAQIHQLPFGFMDSKVGALVGCHIGKMIKFDEENNYGPWRRFMRVRVEIMVEEPLQQELVIEREEGDNIRLSIKYEKLGKFCFVCGVIGHSENFCSEKFEAGATNSKKRWGSYIKAENNSVGGGQKEVNRWIIGNRSKNSGDRNDEGDVINDNQGNLMAIDENGISNHRLYGRIKVGINAETRALTFYKYMECQRSDGTGLVRWWTEIDPTEVPNSEPKQREAQTGGKIFARNLTKCDEVNKRLAEGMNERDEFLYANGGGAEALWKLIDLEAQKSISPQSSKIGAGTSAARGSKGKGQVADSRAPHGGRQPTAHGNQGEMVLFSAAHQQGGPHVQQAIMESNQQSLALKKMSAHEYRQLFSRETAPINVSFNANNAVFQVQKVDKIQQLMVKSNKDQAPVLSPIFNAADNRANLVSTRDNCSQPSRSRGARKDKAVAVAQNKPRKPAVARNPVQPGSFMASARGASRAGGPQDEAGPKKRSRTEAAEDSENVKEGQKVMTVVENPLFEKIETAGPGHQARREQ